MTEERKKSLHPHSKALVEIYNFLYEQKEVFFSITDYQIENIDSTVKTVNATYFNAIRFLTVEDKASAYFCFLIKDHTVIDGNKRLALLWLEIYCKINSVEISPKVDLDVLAIVVEREQGHIIDVIREVKEILFPQK